MARASDTIHPDIQSLTVEQVHAMTDDQLRQHPVLGVMFRMGWASRLDALRKKEEVTTKATTKSTSEAPTLRRTTAATLTAAYHPPAEERVPPLLCDLSIAEREDTLQEKPIPEEKKRQHRNKIRNSYSRYLRGKGIGKLQPDETK